MTQSTRDAFCISLLYVVTSAFWITLSDAAMRQIFAPETAARLQTLKGILFVLVTGLLLFWLMRRSFVRERTTLGAYGESQHRWRELVDNTNDAVVILDGRRIIYANAAAADLIGADDPTVPIGRDINSFLASGDVRGLERRIGIIARGAAVPAGPIRIRRLDGSERTIQAHSTSIKFYDYPVVLSILVDVTERLEQRKMLNRAKEEAEQLARMKTTILHNMSHEIRTPLTGIVGISEILASEVTGQARDLAMLLQDSGWRLMRTLDSILTLAQLESGSVDLAFEAVDLVDTSDKIIRTFEPQAEEKDIHLELVHPNKAIYTQADPAALDQMLMNLVSNAVKFTNCGGVTVRIKADDEHAYVIIDDTGVGISEGFLPHVFDEYRQESQGLSRNFEGSGLGLTIAKRLTEKAGGDIVVKSQKGVGTTVQLTLPLASVVRSHNAA